MASSSEAPWAQAQAALSIGTTSSFATVTVSAWHTKAQRLITQLLDRLPMTIVAHIETVSFWRADNKHPHRFTIVFDNQHTLELTDINSFPSDKDLAQVALECP